MGHRLLTFTQALNRLYYESVGQNWERAAMIKARACAGDPATGAAFLESMRPFIWRRYLDFAAIEDIQSIKRQIHAHVGHSEVKVPGHKGVRHNETADALAQRGAGLHERGVIEAG